MKASADGRWRLLCFPVERDELLRKLVERNEREDANAVVVTPEALEGLLCPLRRASERGRGDRGAGPAVSRVRAPGCWDLGCFDGPAARQSIKYGVVDGQPRIGDGDPVVVAVDVLPQAGPLAAGARGEPAAPPAQVVQEARASREVG
ncbi:hypothetical protein [Streptomyces pacificus]|uniref:Uncharacterized protein n=1 Tax=Streptomyces pacificus TaxID=2705029 RepID=A0A6A0AWJ2_9ACTN|nr:hypothetical protein [Streptomyces pacificus]GFH37232.1 hypothetical protein SCWH03_34680 [Streptomyces pacificus]